MSIDSSRSVAPPMSKTQVALTGPTRLSGFMVSTTPKNSSVLPSPIIPSVSAGKIDRLSSSSEKGIEDETPRWYFWKPSPSDENAPSDGFVKLVRFWSSLATMSNATIGRASRSTMFWKAIASVPASCLAVSVRVSSEPSPAIGVLKVARSFDRIVP